LGKAQTFSEVVYSSICIPGTPLKQIGIVFVEFIK
jgi:hypothetical protein